MSTNLYEAWAFTDGKDVLKVIENFNGDKIFSNGADIVNDTLLIEKIQECLGNLRDVSKSGVISKCDAEHLIQRCSEFGVPKEIRIHIRRFIGSVKLEFKKVIF